MGCHVGNDMGPGMWDMTWGGNVPHDIPPHLPYDIPLHVPPIPRQIGCHVGPEVGCHVGHEVGCYVGHEVPMSCLLLVKKIFKYVSHDIPENHVPHYIPWVIMWTCPTWHVITHDPQDFSLTMIWDCDMGCYVGHGVGCHVGREVGCYVFCWLHPTFMPHRLRKSHIQFGLGCPGTWHGMSTHDPQDFSLTMSHKGHPALRQPHVKLDIAWDVMCDVRWDVMSHMLVKNIFKFTG